MTRGQGVAAMWIGVMVFLLGIAIPSMPLPVASTVPVMMLAVLLIVTGALADHD